MSADEQVARLVEHMARDDADNEHLRNCADLIVQFPTAQEGTYGCDTGCEYVRLTAELFCPHGYRESFEYGEFGGIADLLAQLHVQDGKSK